MNIFFVLLVGCLLDEEYVYLFLCDVGKVSELVFGLICKFIELLWYKGWGGWSYFFGFIVMIYI